MLLQILITFLYAALAIGGGYAVYFLLSLPMRRQERAELFLDVIETAAAEGRDLPDGIMGIARMRDRSVGVRFHQLAAHLERGLSLSQSLEAVPHLLPPQILAMLKLGLQLGDVRRVFPACRRLLRDAHSSVRQAQSYLIVIFLVVSPAATAIIAVLQIWVLPKFRDLGRDMELPAATNQFQWLHAAQLVWNPVTAGLVVVLYGGTFLYLAGPHVRRWMPLIYDRLLLRVPWRRRRVQRDFSAMLALLLDTGLKEDKALELAAASVANVAFQKRARRAVADLGRGLSLVESIRHLDDHAEFHWRLTNAIRSGRGFSVALEGWQEALDAQAFQQQQAATHLFTSALVLWNGAIVALVAWCVFRFLTGLVFEGVLW
jgi:type II secretory pathway component PulF